MLHVVLEPLELIMAEIAKPVALQVHHVHQADEVHAVRLEAVPAVALGALAEAVQVAFAVLLQDVVLARDGVHRQLGAAAKLCRGIELRRLGKMRYIAGMDHECRLLRQLANVIQRLLQGRRHVRIGRLVEAKMTVADLHEREFVACGLRAADQARAWHAGRHSPDHGGACPSHALQEAPTLHIRINTHLYTPLVRGPLSGSAAGSTGIPRWLFPRALGIRCWPTGYGTRPPAVRTKAL